VGLSSAWQKHRSAPNFIQIGRHLENEKPFFRLTIENGHLWDMAVNKLHY